MSGLRTGLVQRPEQRQTQQPNPRLYQAMDLLHMPLHELRTRLEQELSENPFLELLEPDEEDSEDHDANERDASDAEETERGEGEDEAPGAEEEVDWDQVLRDGFEVGGHVERREIREHYEPPVVGVRDLRDHLGEQIGFLRLDERERWIADEIVGNIDDDGLLSCSLQDVADGLNASRKSLRTTALANAETLADEDEREAEIAEIDRLFARHDPDEVARVLAVVQRLDPPGVGARDLQECLLLQLGREGREESLAATIVRDHFDALARHLWAEIARAMKTSPVKVQAAADEISKLDPRPGRRHSVDPDEYVVPDLIVDKVGDDYLVFANDADLPRLRLARAYRETVSSQPRRSAEERRSAKERERDRENREFIARKLNSARWLVQVIEQRRETMLGVMRFIVKRQAKFFDKGVQHLKPLTLREVAEHVHVAESTVSRVANDKYVQSPRGVHPLRYFFSGSVPTASGKLTRRGAVARVEALIRAENPYEPLTDDAIMTRLRSEGIKVARRTVAKYRQQLGILSARMRKRLK